MATLEEIKVAPSRDRARLRAETVRAAVMAAGTAPVTRNGLRLVFDAAPQFIANRAGDLVGIDATIRAFRGADELQIDPHRIFVNPPTQVPDGTFTTSLNEN